MNGGNKMYKNEPCAGKQIATACKSESAATTILAMTESLAKLSEIAIIETREKLVSVMRPDYPCTAGEDTIKDFPPLFAELRGNLWTIERNLQALRDCIERTDI
jgi:hypothetical protein